MNIVKYKWLDGKWINWPLVTVVSIGIGCYGFYIESVGVIFSPLIFGFVFGVLQDRYEAEASKDKSENVEKISR